MNRKFTVAAASLAALVALGACSRGDNAEYDTTAGATSGAMATPPTYTPGVGMSTGATTGTTTGATTSVDTTTKKP